MAPCSAEFWLLSERLRATSVRSDSSTNCDVRLGINTYIHGLGLKIGIYTTPNTLTCTGLYGNVPQCVTDRVGIF